MTHEKLREWLVSRVRHQNLLTGNLKSIKKSLDEKMVADYGSKKVELLIMPELDPEKINDKKDTEIATLNSKKNFDILVKKWKKLSEIKGLKLYFVNPKLETDNFWALKPYVHSMISEKSALKQGLKALFNSVEKV